MGKTLFVVNADVGDSSPTTIVCTKGAIHLYVNEQGEPEFKADGQVGAILPIALNLLAKLKH